MKPVDVEIKCERCGHNIFKLFPRRRKYRGAVWQFISCDRCRAKMRVAVDEKKNVTD